MHPIRTAEDLLRDIEELPIADQVELLNARIRYHAQCKSIAEELLHKLQPPPAKQEATRSVLPKAPALKDRSWAYSCHNDGTLRGGIFACMCGLDSCDECNI